MTHDGSEFLNWTINGYQNGSTLRQEGITEYKIHIEPGNHFINGTVYQKDDGGPCSGNYGYITGATSIFVMFFPD